MIRTTILQRVSTYAEGWEQRAHAPLEHWFAVVFELKNDGDSGDQDSDESRDAGEDEDIAGKPGARARTRAGHGGRVEQNKLAQPPRT